MVIDCGTHLAEFSSIMVQGSVPEVVEVVVEEAALVAASAPLERMAFLSAMLALDFEQTYDSTHAMLVMTPAAAPSPASMCMDRYLASQL